MRHGVSGRKLNRDHNHRRALFKNLVSSLIQHGSITTTEAKAKSVTAMVDKLVTKAKDGSVHKQRQIDKVLNQRSLTHKLVHEIAPMTGKRVSGFTRIIKLGQRRGDNTMMVRFEWVDKMSESVKTEKPKTAKATEKKETPKKESKSDKVDAKKDSVKKEAKAAPKKAVKTEVAKETKAEKKAEPKKESAKKETK